MEERHDAIAAANAEDVRAANLDEGALDRLRLDDARIAALGAQLAELAALPPLERAEDAWELENGLRVSVVRIPIGAVGANFEARPNVAVDVAGQLLEVAERRGAAHRRRGAAHGHGARRRGAAPGARRCGAAAGGGRPRALAGSRGRADPRLAAGGAAARDPARQRRDDGGARARGRHARRSHARARRGRRCPLYRRRCRPGEGGGARRGEPRPARASATASTCCSSTARRTVELGPVLERLGIAVREPERARPRVGERHRAHRVGHRARASTRSRRRSRSRTARPRASRRRSSPRTRRRRSASSRATAARRRSGTRRRASPTASRSPARPRRASTSIACPARAGR